MPRTDTAARLSPYLQEALDNEYVQDNLRRGAERLRAAYARSQKRRVKAGRDEKLRRQMEEAVISLSAAAKALAGGPEKKKRRRGRRAIALAALGAAGIGVAVASRNGSEGGEE
jgi:ferric-dicitrate binding protein FerR (iron transport regulator)